MKRLIIAVLGLAATAMAAKPPRGLEPNLYFEPNRGQAPQNVQFLSQGAGGIASLTGSNAVLRIGNSTVRMQLKGAAPSIGQALDPQQGVSSYFTGNKPANWQAGVPHYGRVRFPGVYPGIDVVYYGAGGHLEYDFVVAPGADPNQIRLQYEGMRSLAVGPEGDLLISTQGGEIRQQRPRVYQDIAGTRREIAAGYRIGGQQEVRFSVAAYAKNAPLVIDPVLEYGTYFGGACEDAVRELAVDSQGNVYIAGAFGLPGETADCFRSFNSLPMVGTATLMKFSPATNSVLYVVHLGGGYLDVATSVALDGDDNAYITGSTQSANFPVVNPFQATSKIQPGGVTGFVTKISPDGKTLLYSTYLGGNVYDAPISLTVDSTGAAYVAGSTQSSDFPLVNPVQSTFGGPVVLASQTVVSEMLFLSKLSPAGDKLLYSTLYGGTGWNQMERVLLDKAGSIYLAGFTTATDFPLVNPIQSTLEEPVQGPGRYNQSAFAVKLAADGQSVVYATYLGGDSVTGAETAAVDAEGNFYLAGSTLASDFPVVNALQSTWQAGWKGFLSKLNAQGSALLYSTYLGAGGSDSISVTDIQVDAAGNVYGVGNGVPALFAAKDPIGPGKSGATVFKLSPSGTSVIWATQVGGSKGAEAGALALDASGAVYMVGTTASTDFPTKNPFQAAKSGLDDVFLVKLTPPATALTLDPSTLELTATAGTATGSRQVTVLYTDGPVCDQCTVEVVTLDGASWLVGNISTADGSGHLNVTADASSLAPGSYTGTIRLTPPTGGVAVDLVVTLTVVAQ